MERETKRKDARRKKYTEKGEGQKTGDFRRTAGKRKGGTAPKDNTGDNTRDNTSGNTPVENSKEKQIGEERDAEERKGR